MAIFYNLTPPTEEEPGRPVGRECAFLVETEDQGVPTTPEGLIQSHGTPL